MEAAPQCGVEIYPLVQLAEGGLRAKSRTVELGKFRAPVCTYLESFHIFLNSLFLYKPKIRKYLHITAVISVYNVQ